jgi:hypothetical protein
MGDQRADFAVTKYGYDREHELELGEFTHSLEMEQIKLLILLNGGAATAFLTFGDKTGLARSVLGLGAPVACWLVGLCVGAAATIQLRRTQTSYTQAFNLRRRAEEWRQLRLKHLEDAAIRARVNLPDQKALNKLHARFPEVAFVSVSKDGAAHHDCAANLVIRKARKANPWIFRLSLASIGLFMAGALLATWFILSTPSPPAASPPANTAAATR